MLSEEDIKDIIEKFDLYKNKNTNINNLDTAPERVITLKLDHVTTPCRETLLKNA
jgi:hypothetical protein